MYRLEIRQLVIGGIDTHAEEQPRVSPIYDLRTALELDEIRLIFLVSRGDQAVDLDEQEEPGQFIIHFHVDCKGA